MARSDDLPDDPGELKKLLAERDAALAEKDALLAAKDALLAKREAAWQQLKAALVWFRQRMFGRSSEKISRGALEELLACCAAVFGEDDLTHEGACGASSEESGAGKSATEEVAPAGDVADGEAAKRGGEDGEEGEEEEFQLVEGYLRRRGGGRRDHSQGLPRVVEEHELADEDRLCPCCGDPMEKIAAEEIKLLDFLAPLFYSMVHARSKYVCKKEGCKDQVAPVTAPVPKTPLYKSFAGPGLLAHLLVSKYGDHLPLERQRKMYKRFGVDIAVSTMVRWVGRSADFLEPLYQLLKEEVLASDIVQTDDTKITVLHPTPPGKKTPAEERPPPKKARIWTYRGDAEHPYVVFDATEDWKKEGPAEFLAGYEGILQSDAYGGYDQLHKEGKVTEAGCHAHARRGFHKAKAVDKRAAKALDFYRRLYKVEKKAKKQKLSAEERLQLRQAESAPLMDSFREWLDEVEPKALPKGPLAEAIGYVRNQWEALTLFLTDGRIAIDNNASERELRQVVVGRNNWKFAGSDAGARRAAIVYSVIASAVRNSVDPLAYLRNVFSELPGLPRDGPVPRDLLESFLPDRWAIDAKVQDALFAHVGPKVLRALSESMDKLAKAR